MVKKENISFYYEVFDDLNEVDSDVIQAFELAKRSTLRAYANYSNFLVGAVLILKSGEFIEATNQENASYPNGLCAESLAFFYASSKYPKSDIKAIIIVARKRTEEVYHFTAPCGSCRQVMLEYELNQKEKIPVYLTNVDNNIIRIPSVEGLLPLSFSANDLK